MQIHPPWKARFTLTREQVYATIEAQFPELAIEKVELLGSGWDNDVWLLDGCWTARFPRRRLAIELIEQERIVLPALLERLPLPTAAPCYFGQPDKMTPHPYNIAPFLAGMTCCRANPSPEERAHHAPVIGRFLRELHGSPLSLVTEEHRPMDTYGRAALDKRMRWFRGELEVLGNKGLLAEPERFIQGLETLRSRVSEPAPHELCWVHGDLYVRHLLMDLESRELCGVIDWGDVHVGDPALDLGIAMTYLPESAHDAFCDAYGWSYLTEGLWDRAQFLSLRSGVALLGYGTDIEDEDLIREARFICDNFLNLF